MYAETHNKLFNIWFKHSLFPTKMDQARLRCDISPIQLFNISSIKDESCHVQMMEKSLPHVTLYVVYIIFMLKTDGDQDHPGNFNNCSLYHCRAILQISSKSIFNILRNISLNRQTHTDKHQQKHNIIAICN